MAGPTIPTFTGRVQLVTSAGTALWTAITAPTATLAGLLNTLSMAVYNATPTTRTEGQVGPLQASARGAIHSRNDELFPGEDVNAGVVKVEQQFTWTRCTADTLVKTGAGFVHKLIFQSTDAVPTAGQIDLTDAIAAAGTVAARLDVKATAPVGLDSMTEVEVNAHFNNGIYIDFTTVADVAVTVVWR